MTTPESPDERSALATVVDLIKATIGEDHLLGIEIGMDTTLIIELEIDSIALIVLMARLTEEYGQRVDLPAWLSGLNSDEIASLTVGDLVGQVIGSSR